MWRVKLDRLCTLEIAYSARIHRPALLCLVVDVDRLGSRGWACVGRRSVRLFHVGVRLRPWGLGCQVAVVGGPQAWVNSSCQGCSHGQSTGRCSTSRRAELAIRAGTLISCARMVPVVALAWKTEARQPEALVRLNAIAAQTSQALFAPKDADGK